jgi:hypothetical protein
MKTKQNTSTAQHRKSNFGKAAYFTLIMVCCGSTNLVAQNMPSLSNNSEAITISATDIGEPARYTWRNEGGQLVHDGREFTKSFSKSELLTVTATAISDGYKSEDAMQVQYANASINGIYPNPVINAQSFDASISTTMTGTKSLLITNGQGYYSFNVPSEEGTHIVNCSLPSPGVYTAVLICNGTITDTETLLVQ